MTTTTAALATLLRHLDSLDGLTTDTQMSDWQHQRDALARGLGRSMAARLREDNRADDYEREAVHLAQGPVSTLCGWVLP